MRLWLRVGIATLLLVTGVSAAVLDGRNATRGSLTAAAQTVTGATTHQVDFGTSWKGRWLFFTFRNTGAGSGTVRVEVNCAERTAAAFGTSWVPVSGSSRIVAAATADGVSIEQPGCQYRGWVESCTTCAVDVTYVAGPQID